MSECDMENFFSFRFYVIFVYEIYFFKKKKSCNMQRLRLIPI